MVEDHRKGGKSRRGKTGGDKSCQVQTARRRISEQEQRLWGGEGMDNFSYGSFTLSMSTEYPSTTVWCGCFLLPAHLVLVSEMDRSEILCGDGTGDYKLSGVLHTYGLWMPLISALGQISWVFGSRLPRYLSRTEVTPSD